MRRVKLLLFSLALCLFALPACALADSVNRALLVGCDTFVSQPSTAPSSENNVNGMADTLSGGAMNLETLVTRKNDVINADQLEELVLHAFADADEDDVSYFYISTHGVWTSGQPNGDMTLLLSDGVHEDGVTAARLRAIFDQVKGTKVLMIDACHAGAMIGKGVHAPFTNVFVGSDYKVLCSSGGAEESWFWSGGTEETLVGAGYFSGALMNGLSVKGGYGADSNRDGAITMDELKHYLLDNHGASTPQSYPEESDFVLLRYDVTSYNTRRRDSTVEGLTFEDDVLSAQDPQVDFSFTVLKPAQFAYQLVFQQGGKWDFAHARMIYDDAERFGAFGDASGYLSSGMKQRSITLSTAEAGSYGYVLMQMLSISGGVPSLVSSRVLCVPPASGDPLLEILADERFCPEKGEELGFVVHHQYPCELSVTIEDMTGATIRRISSRRQTRPLQILPLGSTFCWNGLTNDGDIAPEGLYRARIMAYIGDEVYESLSEPFVLLSQEG